LKQFWIQIGSKAPEKEKLLKFASEVGDVIVENSSATMSSNKQTIRVVDGFDEDLIRSLKHEGKTIALRIAITGKQDENNAVKAAELSTDYIIINCFDWRVIPLENLIARTRGKSVLIAEVTNAQDAKLVLEALELGTDGILLTTSDICEIEKTAAIVKPLGLKIGLVSAKIVTVAPIDTGARVCVDTCDIMAPGEGILVGSQSAGLFLVEAEVHENPYVAARPFRVNAGSISMYTFGSMQNTRYLSELKAGDEIIITNREGKVRKANVGRVKIEYRPLMLIEAEVSGKKIKTILQNAETIRMVTPKGSTPVTELKAGDKVLVHLAAKGGRHFGISVAEETVIER
jgi:3-dehydroquinate synthase II